MAFHQLSSPHGPDSKTCGLPTASLPLTFRHACVFLHSHGELGYLSHVAPVSVHLKGK